jgi:GNAT superfamily N-acetyltransferase
MSDQRSQPAVGDESGGPAPAPLRLEPVASPATSAPLRALLTEYLHWVAGLAGEQFGFSWDVDAMVDSDLHDAAKFSPPTGRCYLVGGGSAYVGVGCLMRLAQGFAEIQRMYVQPHSRGMGAGRRLVAQLIDDARAVGYRTVRLESLKALAPAHELYRSAGFVEIAPDAETDMGAYQPAADMGRYRESVLFMELVL